jgi:hypothetical protein
MTLSRKGGGFMGLWGRWFVATCASIAAFIAFWWGMRLGFHMDSATALGVAAVPFTIVLTLGGAWADQARRKKEGLVIHGQSGTGSWPDPSFVERMNDYSQTLHRTWVRAGAPSTEETVRRTGSSVTTKQVDKVLSGYSRYPVWESADLDVVLLVLDGWGVPDSLVKGWQQAGVRALQAERDLHARDDRRLYRGQHPLWFVTTILAYLVTTWMVLFAAASYPHLFEGAQLGAGNWVAAVLTTLVLLWFFALANVMNQTRMAIKATILSQNSLKVFWIAALYLGFRFGHGTSIVSRIGIHISDYLMWRF